MPAKPSRLSRFTRSLLWYAAFLVMLPLWAYGTWVDTNLWLALLGLPTATLMVYFSIEKLVCPACGKAVRVIGSGLPHCMYCGTAYQKNPDPQATGKPDAKRQSDH